MSGSDNDRDEGPGTSLQRSQEELADLGEKPDVSDAVIVEGLEEIKTEIKTLEARFWHGPLPPPAALKEYGDVVPDMPERLLQLWEQQSAHRQRLESEDLAHFHRMQHGELRKHQAGLALAAIIILLLGLLIYFVASIHAGVALALVGVLLGLAALFIVQRRAEVPRSDEKGDAESGPREEPTPENP